MNKAILVGRLVKDPEIRQTTSGKTVASFTLAINEGKDSSGNELTQYINCVAWEKLAEIMQKYTKKGYKVLVVGSLRTTSWDKPDGGKGYKTEVYVRELELLTSKVEAEHLNQIYTNEEDSKKESNSSSTQTHLQEDNYPEIDVDSIDTQVPF